MGLAKHSKPGVNGSSAVIDGTAQGPATDSDRRMASAILRLAAGGKVRPATLADLLGSRHPWGEIASSIRETADDHARPSVPWDWARARSGQDAGDRVARALESARAAVDAEPDEAGVAYATLADAVAMIGEMDYLWPCWIPKGALTVLAADGGKGKTRVALAIAERLYRKRPMPDGAENPYPAGTKTLWVMADRNFQETAAAGREIGLPPEAIVLNTRKDGPLDLPDFDDPATIEALREQVGEVRPAMVVIDTITYATSHNTNRAEEAKVAFEPIIRLAVDTGIPVLALAHLNAGGTVLGRRIVERARSVISLTDPDPDQPDRRKLFVSKSAMKKPEPLGITFRDLEVEFDFDPPSPPEEEPTHRGRKPSKTKKIADWLATFLEVGPRPVVDIVNAARDVGLLPSPSTQNPKPSISSLYDAQRNFARLRPGQAIDEFEAPGSRSSKMLKHWQIVNQSQCNDEFSGEAVL